MPTGGGAATTIATIDSLLSATWEPHGILVGQLGGLLRVSAAGAIEPLVRVAADERIHGPQMLPDGKTILFTVAKNSMFISGGWDTAQVVAQSVADGTRKILVDGASDGRYLPTGHLMHAIAGTLFAAPFDVKTLTVTHPSVPVLPGVRRATGRASASRHFAFSESGTVVYVPGPATTPDTAALVIGDSLAAPTLLKVPPGEYAHPRVSPDGRTVAVVRRIGAETDISTYGLSGAAELRRLTFGGNNSFPVWSGDSMRIAFQSARQGNRAIIVQSADKSNVAEPVTKPMDGEEHRPESWSRDGLHLLFSILKNNKFTLWVLTVSTKRSAAFGGVESAEPLSASFSPDGKWVAYASTATAGGILSLNRGVFVQPFPATGELYQAPKKFLDFHPVWAPDGRSIYYVSGAVRPTVRVPVTTSPAVAFGTPEDLPRGPQPGLLSGDIRGYDIFRDGRFISLASTSDEGLRAVRILSV